MHTLDTTHYVCLNGYLLDQEKAISDLLMVQGIRSNKIILQSLSYLPGDSKMEDKCKVVLNPFMIIEEQF